MTEIDLPTGAPPGPTVELRDSSALLERPADLRERADRDGYLFFRGLLDPEQVLDVRSQVMRVVAAYGWLRAGSDPLDGIADVAAFDRVDPAEAAFAGTGVPPDAYRDVYRLQALHALGHAPALTGLYAKLLDGRVLRQPMAIARVMIPGSRTAPTPPHQDFIHIQGSERVWTAWIPLGDCPRELGGLAVLVGSHRDGLLTYHASQGAGALEAYLCETGRAWATTDFRAGDVLTFASLTVHSSRPNLAGERVRLSLDQRYQRDDEPITRETLAPHHAVMEWDDVYRGWTDPALQYYWRDYDLTLVDFDEEFRWQKHRIC